MYYKVIKSNISFNNAINAFNNKSIIRYKDYTIYDPAKIHNINDEKFSLEQIQSHEWNIIVPDNDMENKLDEIRDMMDDINLDIDSRFYDESRMDISSYWQLFENQFLLNNDDLKYHIMKWYYNNKHNNLK